MWIACMFYVCMCVRMWTSSKLLRFLLNWALIVHYIAVHIAWKSNDPQNVKMQSANFLIFNENGDTVGKYFEF